MNLASIFGVGSKSKAFTKKGSGRVASKSGRKSGAKLAKAKARHIVGLKNAVVSVVQAHFDEKAKERFLASHD
jgi:hypothetical protein